MQNEFLEDVLAGLRLPQKELSPKYFYDAQGSKYFDQICELDEYYLYRTELAMLPKVARELQSYFTEHSVADIKLVEFGAGSLHKVKPVLKELTQVPGLVREFTAIDISGDHLQAASAELSELFPNLPMKAVQGDFTKAMPLNVKGTTPVGFFPGSTIGNFSPEEAFDFLHNARATLGEGSYMLLGVDTKKDQAILERAYDDSSGVTALFNKNILVRINRELDGDFELNNFTHVARYNEAKGRIEMHLRSLAEQQVTIAGHTIPFAAGETIHTENSHKYHPDEFTKVVNQAGWQRECLWLAPDDMFAIMLLKFAD